MESSRSGASAVVPLLDSMLDTAVQREPSAIRGWRLKIQRAVRFDELSKHAAVAGQALFQRAGVQFEQVIVEVVEVQRLPLALDA